MLAHKIVPVAMSTPLDAAGAARCAHGHPSVYHATAPETTVRRKAP